MFCLDEQYSTSVLFCQFFLFELFMLIPYRCNSFDNVVESYTYQGKEALKVAGESIFFAGLAVGEFITIWLVLNVLGKKKTR